MADLEPNTSADGADTPEPLSLIGDVLDEADRQFATMLVTNPAIPVDTALFRNSSGQLEVIKSVREDSTE